MLQTLLEDCSLKQKGDQKLIKQIVRCYLRLTDHPKSPILLTFQWNPVPRAREILRQILLPFLKKIGFEFITDETTKKIHIQLLHNLYKSDSELKNSFAVKNKNPEEQNY